MYAICTVSCTSPRERGPQSGNWWYNSSSSPGPLQPPPFSSVLLEPWLYRFQTVFAETSRRWSGIFQAAWFIARPDPSVRTAVLQAPAIDVFIPSSLPDSLWYPWPRPPAAPSRPLSQRFQSSNRISLYLSPPRPVPAPTFFRDNRRHLSPGGGVYRSYTRRCKATLRSPDRTPETWIRLRPRKKGSILCGDGVGSGSALSRISVPRIPRSFGGENRGAYRSSRSIVSFDVTILLVPTGERHKCWVISLLFI